MKLTYSILWFDDTEDFFDSLDLDPLKETVKSWGFDAKIEFVSDPGEFMGYSPFKDFDLIIVDYNLENFDAHGQDFIKKIRGHDVYTEIIFYSANPASELWDAIRSQLLEGIFVSNRPGVLSKIEKVANQSVKKILDLENMRGIVMAEIGDIDLILNELIEVGLNGLDEEKQNQVFESFKSRLSSQLEKANEEFKRFIENPSISGVIYLCSDSYKRWLLLKSIAKRHSKLNTKGLGDFNNEVLIPRNCLAHGIPTQNEDGSYTFSHHNKEYLYNEESSTKLRKLISDYKLKFESFKDSLS